MSMQKTGFGLMLPPRAPGTPAYRWLQTALRLEILEGRLRPGARLPATRELASLYGLSRGTIVNAFEQLQAEGYVQGSVGSGTYVSTVLPDDLLQVTRHAGAPPLAPPKTSRRFSRPFSRYGVRVRPFPSLETGAARAFRTNLPALDLFPTTLWTQITARRLRRVSTSLLYGCGPMGYRPLQEAVADYLGASRGVRCLPEQVAILSGVQEALDLAARLFLDPGDRVCMEDPGYVGATLAFKAAGATIAAAPVDDEGMELRPRHLRGARLVYITPGHQSPLGMAMSLPRRLALLDWARKAGALIIEDDYDSEYRYSGRPIPALQGLDRHGLVLFSGTFSKVLFPSLRIGYLVVPRDMVERVAAAKSVMNRHAPVLEQAVLCDFITDGHFARHVRRMREVYAERLSVLLEEARLRLAGLLEISPVEAGLQTVGWLRDGIDAESAAQGAAARGVEVTPLGDYSQRRMTRQGWVLGFAAADKREIRRGVRELAALLEDAVTQAPVTQSAAPARPRRRREPTGVLRPSAGGGRRG
jgi:GntR family transcriptional regulator/MocR family aminotransferase